MGFELNVFKTFRLHLLEALQSQSNFLRPLLLFLIFWVKLWFWHTAFRKNSQNYLSNLTLPLKVCRVSFDKKYKIESKQEKNPTSCHRRPCNMERATCHMLASLPALATHTHLGIISRCRMVIRMYVWHATPHAQRCATK